METPINDTTIFATSILNREPKHKRGASINNPCSLLICGIKGTLIRVGIIIIAHSKVNLICIFWIRHLIHPKIY